KMVRFSITVSLPFIPNKILFLPAVNLAWRSAIIIHLQLLLSAKAERNLLTFLRAGPGFIGFTKSNYLGKVGGALMRGLPLMKIATWNVNSIAVRLPQALDWMEANRPDALCLQETKCVDAKFPFEAFREIGYAAEVFGQPTYNGVAILSLSPAADTR